jgi:hypothetical protein
MDSLLYGAVFAMASALALGLMAFLETPLDLGSAATPMDLLAVNRTTDILQAVLVAPVVAIATALTGHVLVDFFQSRGGPPLSLRQCFLAGSEYGIVAAVCYVLVFTAWGQWVLFTRICLPLTGRLHWATMAFLDDAYRRGVLRPVGAVHQFRHARLQHHLSPHPHVTEHDRSHASA